jgi:hypothetical protein
MQEVWYFLENAGMAFADGAITNKDRIGTIEQNRPRTSFFVLSSLLFVT